MGSTTGPIDVLSTSTIGRNEPTLDHAVSPDGLFAHGRPCHGNDRRGTDS